jgi:ribosome maturation protein SDO1
LRLRLTVLGKKRFEVACYKNKILDYRNGIEKEVDNVLQTPNVYFSVGKGQTASAADLKKAWPNVKETKEATVLQQIVKDILQHGDEQVGEKERAAEIDRLKHEVIDIVTSKLINPQTNSVYTPTMIEKALDQLSSQSASQQSEKVNEAAIENLADEEVKKLPRWTGVTLRKEARTPEAKAQEAKSQALFAMKCLIAHQPMPLRRIQMKVRVTCPTSILKHTVKSASTNQQEDAAEGEKKVRGTVKDTISGYIAHVESEDTAGAEWEVIGLVDPGAYKLLTDFVGNNTKGRGQIEVLDNAVGVEV